MNKQLILVVALFLSGANLLFGQFTYKITEAKWKEESKDYWGNMNFYENGRFFSSESFEFEYSNYHEYYLVVNSMGFTACNPLCKYYQDKNEIWIADYGTYNVNSMTQAVDKYLSVICECLGKSKSSSNSSNNNSNSNKTVVEDKSYLNFTPGSQFNSSLTYGSFKDSRDGINYKTIKIGTQTWFAENLRYKTSSGSWAYDNDESNVEKYGRLYTWEAAKKACPTGWHLPSDAEWTKLTTYLGGENTVRTVSVFVALRTDNLII